MNTKKARQLRKKFLKEPSKLVNIGGAFKWIGGRRKYQDEKKAYNRDVEVKAVYDKRGGQER